MRFSKKKVQGILDVEVHYTCDIPAHGETLGFEVVATAEGIYFQGRSPWFSDPESLQVLAQTIGLACTDSLRLRKCKIALPPSLAN